MALSIYIKQQFLQFHTNNKHNLSLAPLFSGAVDISTLESETHGQTIIYCSWSTSKFQKSSGSFVTKTSQSRNFLSFWFAPEGELRKADFGWILCQPEHFLVSVFHTLPRQEAAWASSSEQDANRNHPSGFPRVIPDQPPHLEPRGSLCKGGSRRPADMQTPDKAVTSNYITGVSYSLVKCLMMRLSIPWTSTSRIVSWTFFLFFQQAKFQKSRQSPFLDIPSIRRFSGLLFFIFFRDCKLCENPPHTFKMTEPNRSHRVPFCRGSSKWRGGWGVSHQGCGKHATKNRDTWEMSSSILSPIYRKFKANNFSSRT